jgi:hypothetical protein
MRSSLATIRTRALRSLIPPPRLRAHHSALLAHRARIVCTVCGAIGTDARPNWNERAEQSKAQEAMILIE